jgi:MFS family permease
LNIAGIKKFISPWFYGYSLQGIAVLGIVPILMPIIVAQETDASTAGIVVASFYVGQLFGPLSGALSDRFLIHRFIYLLGFVFLGVGLLIFPYVSSTVFWVLLALLQGFGSVSSNTVAGMFIVERYEKSEWDTRIGLLQTFYGVGQAIGLGLAAIFFSNPTIGYMIAAALMIPGFFIGIKSIPTNRHNISHINLRGHFSHHKHMPSRSPMMLLNALELSIHKAVFKLKDETKTKFGLFIVGWFSIMLGNWLLYNLYPLLMNSAFGMHAGYSSMFNALGAVIGIFLYAPSGALGKKIGDGKVILIGIAMSLVAVAIMAFCAYFEAGEFGFYAAGLAFMLIPASWSPLIVGGTAWSVELSSLNQGETLGIFNSTLALACVLSALGAGYIADFLGFKAVLLVSLAFTIASFIVVFRVTQANQEAR